MAVYHIRNLTQTYIEDKSTQSLLIREISRGSAVHIQGDKHVMKMGIIIDTPSRAEDPSKNSNFEELENYTGVPLDAFVNYSISDGSRGDMALIMSGCSKPMDRIAECTRVADKARALFEIRMMRMLIPSWSCWTSCRIVRQVISRLKLVARLERIPVLMLVISMMTAFSK